VYERLLDRRIVIAHGLLGDEGATQLCAQLLTLDAEGDAAIRMELHCLDSELPAALTVMGVLDVVGVPLHAYAAGRISGAALGVLVAPGEVFYLSPGHSDVIRFNVGSVETERVSACAELLAKAIQQSEGSHSTTIHV